MFPTVLRNLEVCVFPRRVPGIHLAFVGPGATAGDGPSDRFAVEGDAAGAARACRWMRHARCPFGHLGVHLLGVREADMA